MKRLSLVIALGILACAVEAQVQRPRPTFDVASVKVHPPNDPMSSVGSPAPNRYTATNLSLELLIINAYNLRPGRLEGIPGSMSGPRFDVVATTDGPRTDAEKDLMLQSLLADRFKLVLGRKQVEGDIYVLLADRADGRLGPNIKPSPDECTKAAELLRSEATQDEVSDETVKRCFSQTGNLGTGLQAKGMSMARLAGYLSTVSGQVIEDRSDLRGVFDFQLRGSVRNLRMVMSSPSTDTADAPPSIFNALRDQLGMKLERRRVPIEHLVVEHVEMPTPD